MIEHIDHINIVVRDLDAMTAFYTEALGLAVTKRVTIRGPWIDQVVGLSGVEADVVYLDAPAGPRTELIDYRRAKGAGPEGLSAPFDNSAPRAPSSKGRSSRCPTPR